MIVLGLSIFAFALAAAMLALAVGRLIRAVQAEQKWVDVVQSQSGTRARLIAELEREACLLVSGPTSAFGEGYLNQVLSDMLANMEREHSLSAGELRRIRRALQQPSARGRNAYARKLAEEGIRGRVSYV